MPNKISGNFHRFQDNYKEEEGKYKVKMSVLCHEGIQKDWRYTSIYSHPTLGPFTPGPFTPGE